MKPYRCRTCSKTFANSSYLWQHERIHTDNKPYSCPTCAAKFRQHAHLQQHLRTHSGERPYRCTQPGCTKSYSQLCNLQFHSRSHIDPLTRPHKCRSCYRCFGDEASLRAHILRHMDTKRKKRHICRRCGAAYAQEALLAHHMVSRHRMTTDIDHMDNGHSDSRLSDSDHTVPCPLYNPHPTSEVAPRKSLVLNSGHEEGPAAGHFYLAGDPFKMQARMSLMGDRMTVRGFDLIPPLPLGSLDQPLETRPFDHHAETDTPELSPQASNDVDDSTPLDLTTLSTETTPMGEGDVKPIVSSKKAIKMHTQPLSSEARPSVVGEFPFPYPVPLPPPVLIPTQCLNTQLFPTPSTQDRVVPPSTRGVLCPHGVPPHLCSCHLPTSASMDYRVLQHTLLYLNAVQSHLVRLITG